MADSRAGRTVRAARRWHRQRVNRHAVHRFQDFWSALQRVGDALADAEKAAKAAQDTKSATWRPVNTRHWELASADEVRGALRACRASMRVCSNQAKRFEPELIRRDWSR